MIEKILKYPLIFLFVAGAVIYLPTVNISFFSDETDFIGRNKIESLSELASVFEKKDFDSIYYRPLGNLAAGIISAAAGYKTELYRIINFLLHIFNSWVVYIFICQIFRDEKRKEKALLAAFLFLIFPLHDLSVIWHTDLFDRVLFSFYIGSVIMFLRKGRWNFLSLLLLLCALLTKETSFGISLVIFISSYFIIQKGLRDSVLNTSPYILLTLFIILMRIILFDNNVFAVSVSNNDPGLTAVIKNYIFYSGLLILPVFTNIFQDFIRANLIWFILPAIPVIFFAARFMIKKGYKNRILVFSVLFIILALAPSSRLLMKWYLYIPSVGFIAFVSLLLFDYVPKKYVTYALLAISLIYLAGNIYNQTSWINLTGKGDKIISKFETEFHDVVSDDKPLIFLTIPGKVNNFSVYHLQFDKLLSHKLGITKEVDIYSRSAVESFADEIKLDDTGSCYKITHTGGNSISEYGYEYAPFMTEPEITDGKVTSVCIKVDNIDCHLVSFSGGRFFVVR